MKKAGRTNLEVGTRVQIQGIKGEDKHLNGLTGEITHPFGFGETGKEWVGVYLDGDNRKCNVKTSELKIL